MKRAVKSIAIIQSNDGPLTFLPHAIQNRENARVAAALLYAPIYPLQKSSGCGSKYA